MEKEKIIKIGSKKGCMVFFTCGLLSLDSSLKGDIICNKPAYNIETSTIGGYPLKGYIEERAVEIANYIIDNNATVRQTAKQFGISKSTVHTDVS